MSPRGSDGIGIEAVIADIETLDAIVAHARHEAPAECCGILAGEPGGRVTCVFPMTNTRGSAEEFLMDPAEQFAVLDQMRAQGLAMTAVYHSHPTSPARPSAHDISMAFYPELAYVIVSLAGSASDAPGPTARAFRIVDGRVREIPLLAR